MTKLKEGKYQGKTLLKLLGETDYTWKNRKEDFLEYLKDFCEYDYVNCGARNSGVFVIKEVFEEDYKKLPRKNAYSMQEKKSDYVESATEIIATQPYNTPANMGRSVLSEPIRTKHHHSEYTAARYYGDALKEPKNNFIVSKDNSQWMQLKDGDYIELTQEQTQYINMLISENLSKGNKNMIDIYSNYENKFITREEMKDQLSDNARVAYVTILERFKAKYGFRPFKVPKIVKSAF